MFVLMACSDAISREEFAEMVETARACDSAGSCVLAGAGQCTCAAPVNQANVSDITDAAARVECDDAVVECATQDNVRCEGGRCIADSAP